MVAVPHFPEFRPVEAGMQPEITAFTGQFPSYSDFNFASLYSWNTDNDMSVSWLNGNLALECKDYVADDTFYSFLGNAAVAATAHSLLGEAESQGRHPELRLVPAEAAGVLADSHDFKVVEDPDQHDYLLSVPELAALRGRRHSHTRQAVNSFQRGYGELASFREGDISDGEMHHKLYGIFQGREAAKGADAHKELVAFERSLGQQALGNLRVFSAYVGEEPQAFITYEQLDSTTGIAHFSKANMQFKGIFQYLMQSLGQTLQTEGIGILNIEQDLGLPNLRQSKQLLRPIGQLKKYVVGAGTDSET